MRFLCGLILILGGFEKAPLEVCALFEPLFASWNLQRGGGFFTNDEPPSVMTPVASPILRQPVPLGKSLVRGVRENSGKDDSVRENVSRDNDKNYNSGSARPGKEQAGSPLGVVILPKNKDGTKIYSLRKKNWRDEENIRDPAGVKQLDGSIEFPPLGSVRSPEIMAAAKIDDELFDAARKTVVSTNNLADRKTNLGRKPPQKLLDDFDEDFFDHGKIEAEIIEPEGWTEKSNAFANVLGSPAVNQHGVVVSPFLSSDRKRKENLSESSSQNYDYSAIAEDAEEVGRNGDFVSLKKDTKLVPGTYLKPSSTEENLSVNPLTDENNSGELISREREDLPVIYFPHSPHRSSFRDPDIIPVTPRGKIVDIADANTYAEKTSDETMMSIGNSKGLNPILPSSRRELARLEARNREPDTRTNLPAHQTSVDQNANIMKEAVLGSSFYDDYTEVGQEEENWTEEGDEKTPLSVINSTLDAEKNTPDSENEVNGDILGGPLPHRSFPDISGPSIESSELYLKYPQLPPLAAFEKLNFPTHRFVTPAKQKIPINLPPLLHRDRFQENLVNTLAPFDRPLPLSHFRSPLLPALGANNRVLKCRLVPILGQKLLPFVSKTDLCGHILKYDQNSPLANHCAEKLRRRPLVFNRYQHLGASQFGMQGLNLPLRTEGPLSPQITTSGPFPYERSLGVENSLSFGPYGIPELETDCSPETSTSNIPINPPQRNREDHVSSFELENSVPEINGHSHPFPIFSPINEAQDSISQANDLEYSSLLATDFSTKPREMINYQKVGLQPEAMQWLPFIKDNHEEEHSLDSDTVHALSEADMFAQEPLENQIVSPFSGTAEGIDENYVFRPAPSFPNSNGPRPSLSDQIFQDLKRRKSAQAGMRRLLAEGKTWKMQASKPGFFTSGASSASYSMPQPDYESDKVPFQSEFFDSPVTIDSIHDQRPFHFSPHAVSPDFQSSSEKDSAYDLDISPATLNSNFEAMNPSLFRPDSIHDRGSYQQAFTANHRPPAITLANNFYPSISEISSRTALPAPGNQGSYPPAETYYERIDKPETRTPLSSVTSLQPSIENQRMPNVFSVGQNRPPEILVHESKPRVINYHEPPYNVDLGRRQKLLITAPFTSVRYE